MRAVRAVLEEVQQHVGCDWTKRLQGACATGALLLDSVLPRAQAIRGAYTPMGQWKPQAHCWVHYGRCILDVTSTQFDDFPNTPLLILPRNNPTVKYLYTPTGGAEDVEEMEMWGSSRGAMERRLLKRVRHYMLHPPDQE
jgi:hypothetical protein